MSDFLLLSLIAGAVVLILSGCASVVYSTKNLPSDYMDRVKTKLQAKPFDPFSTNVGSVYAKELKGDEDISGAALIKNGAYALLHRVALARMAQHTIELQTYIYENDLTGRLLMRELKAAADRGVTVRIIVDDNGLDSDHSDIMALDYHPNIEVKVFNPYKYRSRILRYPQLVFHVARMNYRMHNKLFIVDGMAVIMGGRNVAGNYFDANSVMNFSDTDVLFLGKMAADSVKSFNEYWDYHRSIPVSVFPEQKNPERLGDIDKEISALESEHPEEYARYQHIINEFINHYNARDYDIYWGNGAVIADSPEKAEGSEELSPIVTALEYLWTMTEKSVYISSAYLVPGNLGTEDILRAKRNGVDINILTNSLSSTDASVVYSAWRKYRDELVENGVNVYEFRREGYKVKNHLRSGASLHSKAMVFDDKITWVGSFNLDPRSAAINTEVVGAFYNPDFALKVRQSIEEDMAPERAWRLFSDNGSVVWKTVRNGREEISRHCPDTSFGARLLMILMTGVPESMI